MSVDLSGVKIQSSIGDISKPDSQNVGDKTPLEFNLRLQQTTAVVAWEGGQKFSLTTSTMQTPIVALINTFASALGSSSASFEASANGFEIDNGGTPFTAEIPSPDFGDGDEYDILPRLTLDFKLPAGLVLGQFSAKSGQETVGVDDGRQHITYTLPVAGESDEISFTFIIEWTFLIKELWPYLATFILLFALLIYRRKSKKRKREVKLEKEYKNKYHKKIGTAEFTKMGGFGGGSDFSGPPPAGESGGYDPSPPGVSGFGDMGGDSMSGPGGSGGGDGFYGEDLNWKP